MMEWKLIMLDIKYEDYLSDKLDKYNMILHADIRDTYFQKDVFKLYIEIKQIL